MSDVETEIRKAVGAVPHPRGQDEAFEEIRADVHGALWRAWAKMVPNGRVTVIDIRIHDIVEEYLRQARKT